MRLSACRKIACEKRWVGSTHLARFAGGGPSPSGILSRCCSCGGGVIRVGGHRYREKSAVLVLTRMVILSAGVIRAFAFTHNHLGGVPSGWFPYEVPSLSTSITRCRCSWRREVPEATVRNFCEVK
jgi:hypothetical protein